MILVTGGTGLLGMHVIIDLFKRGDDIRVLSRQSEWPKHCMDVLKYYTIPEDAFLTKVNLIMGDITDITALKEAMKGVKTVFHCAALVSFKKSDYHKLMLINIEGTANVVNAALDADIEKLCYVSSTAAISKKANELIVVEDGNWVRDHMASNYAKSKFMAEREVWRGQEEGLNTVIVNPCVIFGPGNWDFGSGTIFKNGYQGISYFTSGGNAFVDARDVSKVMLDLTFSDTSNARFLVTGENLSFQEMLGYINAAFGHEPPKKAASKWMTRLARRFEAARCFFTGSEPRLTRETDLNIEFTTIKDSAINAAEFHKQHSTY